MNSVIITNLTRDNCVQFLKYAIVGIINNFLGYILFILITNYNVEPKLAMSLLFVFGASLSFWANWQWVFNNSLGFAQAGSRFFMAYLSGYLINLVTLIVFVDHLGYSYQLVEALAIIAVSSFLFVTFKFYVFSVPLFKT